MGLLTFSRGGVHPPENKISAGKKIEFAGLPEQVIIPVSQHLGAPSKVLVNRGDEVKTGQLIAQAEGFISTNIHSSVTGKVLKVDKFPDTSGYKKLAVQIQVETEDNWEEGIDTSDDLLTNIDGTPGEIRNKILAAGIVGLGGATFPSHVKLMTPKGKKAEYLLINGVECEPYLTADHALMLEKHQQLVVGINILMKGLGVEKAIIGIENNKPDAIEVMTRAVAEEQGISVQGLKVKYPQGGEKQLVQALLKREVPSGGLPIDVGVVVFNVGTAFASYLAVQKNRPLIERVVTVTGKSVANPSNFLTRIGTPASFIIEKGMEGFSIGTIEDKMGIRGSQQAELVFQDLRVPKENLLGKEGRGFGIAMATLDGGRIGVASQALGIAQGALDVTVKYAKEREQFGRPIGKFQGLRWMMADMETRVQAARYLVYAAAYAKDNNKRYSKEAAMAKMYASDTAMDVTTKAVQIHGGYGYTKDYPVERFMRDAKITQIYEGTNEVQKMVIAGSLGL